MSKVLVISGGSRGIGAKTIELFQKHQWRVVNLSRTTSELTGVENLSVDFANFQLDSAQQQTLKNHLQSAEQICLVHNAGILERDSVKDLTPKALEKVLNVNLVSSVALNEYCMPYLKKGSSIIYIGSTLSEIGVPGRASYVVSKHAVVGLMRATCQDLAREKIHTCCICPGLVNTSMLTDAFEASALKAFVSKKVTMERLIEPEEIAELIHFCAEHPVINGSVLHANLGQTTD